MVEPHAFPHRPGSCDVENETVQAITTSKAVELIVGHLPKEQAEVVLLRLLGGLEVEQVARILNKKPGTIRVLQHRAIKKLAALLPGLAVKVDERIPRPKERYARATRTRQGDRGAVERDAADWSGARRLRRPRPRVR